MAKRTLIVLLALLAPTGLGACSPPVPASPSYAADVQPIFVAHCTRCHGAGDMLQADPPVTDPLTKGAPLQGYLGHFEDRGDCTPADGGSVPTAPTCMRGAAYYGMGSMVGYALWNTWFPRMPPPPAAALNNFERDVILKWIQNPKP
jgi:hypothetical protein